MNEKRIDIVWKQYYYKGNKWNGFHNINNQEPYNKGFFLSIKWNGFHIARYYILGRYINEEENGIDVIGKRDDWNIIDRMWQGRTKDG